MRIGKFKINHYINYMVIGLITLVMGTVSLAGGRFDNSLLFLMEKIAISIILAVSLSLVASIIRSIASAASAAGVKSMNSAELVVLRFTRISPSLSTIVYLYAEPVVYS